MHCIERPEDNRLLAALPKAEFERLRPNLEFVRLARGREIASPWQQLSYAYFPTSAIVSKMYETVDGDSTEVAMVGNEGVVGISLFMGGDVSPYHAVVETAGCAYRLPKSYLSAEFERRGVLMHLLLRYAQALVTQMSQIAVCNRHHRIQQQLSRWLLMSLDRHPEAEIDMTHEHVATMLGVRREGVTEAAGKLHAAGLINYKRGKVQILIRSRLEREACECYGVIQKEYERLLPLPIVGMHIPEQPSNPKLGVDSPCELSKTCANRNLCEAQQENMHALLGRDTLGEGSHAAASAIFK